MMPVAGQLTNRYDPRKLIGMGLVVGAWSMFSLSHLNLNTGYWDVFWPQVIQGGAMAFLFIPLMAVSMSGIAKEKMGNATSIYNLMRNIGGSFGIATMTTFLARRNQVHQNQLVSRVTLFDPKMRMMLHGLQSWFQTQGYNSVDAAKKSLGAIYGMVQQQAAMLSFVEAFWIMGMVFLGMIPLLFLLRNARDLHPHTPRAVRRREVIESPSELQVEPEPELAGVLH